MLELFKISGHFMSIMSILNQCQICACEGLEMHPRNIGFLCEEQVVSSHPEVA